MPARSRRSNLIAADAQLDRLEAAAERGARATDWLEAAKPTIGDPAGEPLEALAKPAARRRGLWPFGRKPDPEAERKAAILAELEAVVEGRPHAADVARPAEPEPQPTEQPLRAAG